MAAVSAMAATAPRMGICLRMLAGSIRIIAAKPPRLVCIGDGASEITLGEPGVAAIVRDGRVRQELAARELAPMITKSRLRFLRWFGPSCSPSCWSQRWPYSLLSLFASGVTNQNRPRQALARHPNSCEAMQGARLHTYSRADR